MKHRMIQRIAISFIVACALLFTSTAYAESKKQKKDNRGQAMKEQQMEKKAIKKKAQEMKKASKRREQAKRKQLPLPMTQEPVASQQQKQEAALQRSKPEAFVLYTDSGFSPSSFSIKAGTPVTFKNQSGHALWVASAPHPTHTIYPEFDQRASVEKDGVYTFTFSREGTWKYHNHLNPGARGEVVVTE